MLAAGLSARAEPREPVPPSPSSDPGADPENAVTVDLQRQVNELRSDLLDERERRIERQLEANGAALVVLAIVIGGGAGCGSAPGSAPSLPRRADRSVFSMPRARKPVWTPWRGPTATPAPVP